MNERINTQDLVDLFASRHSIPKKEAEFFIKEFFLLIEQALENDRSVKIKGLGTFKLIGIEDRESINVNTGERFLIEGHTKVSFTPDNGLRDVINKPFSHFETVVLHENTVLPDTPIEPVREEEASQEVMEPVTQEPLQHEIPSPPENDSLAQCVEETHLISELSVSSSGAEIHEVVELAQEVITSSETEEITEQIIIGTELTESVGQVPAAGPEPSEEIIQQPQEDTSGEVTEGVPTLVEKEDTVEEETDRNLPADHEVNESQPALPSPSHSFASPARKRLTAEEIIALEIQKADEEYKRSLKIPFLSYSQEKEKQKKEKKEKKQKELKPQREKKEKKEDNGKLQRYLVAVVLLVLFACGGLLLYYYMPEWTERKTGDRLALETPLQETEEVGAQESVEPEEGNIEEVVREETPTAPVVEEQPAVREVVREVSRAAEVPARQQPPVTSGQTTSASAASQTPVPQNIASIPVRPDSVNYVIVGTKATHKIEEGETLTKVAYRFYGTKDLWPYIVMHNRTVIRNPNHVPFGTTIQIPELEKK